jgi:succinate dehydrogenase / fumarate reductase cytochrome b subunit
MAETSDRRSRPHPNQLGIYGWFGGGRWGLDRYLYGLHRLTGLGLLAYFLIHILVTSARALGPGAWEDSMARVTGELFYFGEFLVFLAFSFHAINGVRLALAELGWGVGQPIEPIYPYQTVLDIQRPWVATVVVLTGILALLGALDFFIWH